MKSLQWVFDGDGTLSADELGALEVLSVWPMTEEIEKELKDERIRGRIDQEISRYLQYDEAPMESKHYVYSLYCDMLEKTWEETLTMEDFIVQTSELLADALVVDDEFFPSDVSLSEWASKQ